MIQKRMIQERLCRRATYTFYVNGEVYNIQTLKDGETLTAPADPEADGKTFDGWYTAETDGEKFTAFGVQTVTETKTVDLYAGWLTDADSETDDTSESAEETPGGEAGDSTGSDSINTAEDDISSSDIAAIGTYDATEDENFIVVEKRFVGITESQIPVNFQITVTPENGGADYVLTEEGEYWVGAERTEDGAIVWQWKITGVGTGKYQVSEDNTEISGYELKMENMTIR